MNKNKMKHEEQVSDFHEHLWRAIEVFIERKHESQEYDAFMSWAMQWMSDMAKAPEFNEDKISLRFEQSIAAMKEIGVKGFLMNSEHWKNNQPKEQGI